MVLTFEPDVSQADWFADNGDHWTLICADEGLDTERVEPSGSLPYWRDGIGPGSWPGARCARQRHPSASGGDR